MVRKAAIAWAVLLVSIPAASAQSVPEDPCENNGGSYVPYESPAGILRIVLRVEGAPTPFSWCLYQGDSLLLMRYDLVQQEDTGDPLVYTYDFYPAGPYTIGFLSTAGAPPTGGREGVDMASCASRNAEVFIRIVHQHAATVSSEHRSRCLDQAAEVTPGATATDAPTYYNEEVRRPPWLSVANADEGATAPVTVGQDPAGAFAAGALLLLVVVALGAEKIRFGYLAFLGRTLGNRVLEHPTRRSLVQAIEENPGIHAAALGTMLELRGGRLQHHLAILELRRLVDFIPAAGFRRYFPKGSFSEAEKRMLATLRRSVARQVYESVLGHDAPARELSEQLRISEGQFSKVAHELQSVGLLERREEGARVRWVAQRLPSRIAPYVL